MLGLKGTAEALAFVLHLTSCVAVFVSKEEASQFLRRFPRSNKGNIFEEFTPGNAERECFEESCNYEEAHEVSDQRAIADEWWTKYVACKNGGFANPLQPTSITKNYIRDCVNDGDQCQPNPCGKHTVRCEDLLQAFKCHCKPGYEGKTCKKDIDDCASNPCASESTCVDEQSKCNDIDECELDYCDHDCLNSEGSYECSCLDGFTLADDSADTCVDVNECEEGLGTICTQNCVNTVGSFECSCDGAYIMQEDGFTCKPAATCLGRKNHVMLDNDHFLVGAQPNDFITQSIQSKFDNKISFSLRLRTYDSEGVIVATGDATDYFYIILRNGNLEANIRLDGKGPFPIHRKEVFIADGQWHHVKFTLKGNSYKLQSDGDTVGRMRSSKKPFLSNKRGKVYYGGINEDNELNGIMDINAVLETCLDEIEWKGVRVKWTPTARKIQSQRESCFAEVEPGTYFQGTGYVKINHDDLRIAHDLKFQALVRTSFEDGILISGKHSGRGNFSVGLEEGRMVARVTNNRGKVVHEAIYEKKDRLLCDGLWMSIYAKLGRGTIQLYVDGKKPRKVVNVPGRRIYFNAREPIFFGGTSDAFHPHFKGALRRVRINDREIDFTIAEEYKGVLRRDIPAETWLISSRTMFT